jgi:hypothetical protein
LACTEGQNAKATDNAENYSSMNQVHLKSQSLGSRWEPAFVEIDEVWNALNVVAIGDSHFLFALFEPGRD